MSENEEREETQKVILVLLTIAIGAAIGGLIGYLVGSPEKGLAIGGLAGILIVFIGSVVSIFS